MNEFRSVVHTRKEIKLNIMNGERSHGRVANLFNKHNCKKKVVFISINDYDDYLPIQWYGMNITDRTQMVISLSLSSRISPSTFQYLIFRDHHLLNTTIIFA